MIRIKVLNQKSKKEFNKGLQKVEKKMIYPYGSDSFRIDHGESYFAFFDRMGESIFHIATDKDEVVACGCGISRVVPKNGSLIKVWYLCDLKVDLEYRGRRLPSRLFRRNLIFNYLKCPRGYTISMNPKNEKNRVVELLHKFPLIPARFATMLCFFELSMKEAKSVEIEVSQILGQHIKFLRLSGVKDIILKSTSKPMPLFHAQYGPMADPKATKIEVEGRYMFCTPKSSDLYQLLSSKFNVVTTATVLSHRMDGFDWGFILSSDI